MANVKISQLTAKTSLSANDVFPIVDTDNSATKKVTAESVKDYIRPYKVYTALITTGFERLGTVTELENTIGTITPSYVSTGNIRFTSSKLFENDKTAVFITPGTSPQTNYEVTVRYTISSTSAIDVYTAVSGTDTDELLLNATIEIRVYD